MNGLDGYQEAADEEAKRDPEAEVRDRTHPPRNRQGVLDRCGDGFAELARAHEAGPTWPLPIMQWAVVTR